MSAPTTRAIRRTTGKTGNDAFARTILFGYVLIAFPGWVVRGVVRSAVQDAAKDVRRRVLRRQGTRSLR
jgi:hypothetical protein